MRIMHNPNNTYNLNCMQSFGIGKERWWDLAVFNFWSNKDQVKLSSESPDNSYSNGLFCPFMDPPMIITPLVVGEVTIVLLVPKPQEEKGIFGPVILRIIIYQYHNHD